MRLVWHVAQTRRNASKVTKPVLRLSKGSQGRTAETLRQNAPKVTKVSHNSHKNTTNRCLVLIARGAGGNARGLG